MASPPPTDKYVRNWGELKRIPRRPLSLARAAARQTVLSLTGNLVSAAEGPFLHCLHCHWVFDDQTEDFEHLLKWISDIGAFVDTDTCVSIVRGETTITEPCFHLSFDDGLRNNYTNAAPILRRLGIPAIFFVTSEFVSTGIDGARRYRERLGYDHVFEVAGWDELRQMHDWGFDIGSHTRTHPKLAALSGKQLRSEIVGSKRNIEEQLGADCKYIAWPFGTYSDIDEEALACIKRAGYRGCFGGFRETIVPGQTDPFQIPRHHFEAHWPVSHLRYFIWAY